MTSKPDPQQQAQAAAEHGAPDELEQRIRQRAHEIWEAQGRPSDRSDEHWRQAREELGSDRDAVAAATNYGTQNQDAPSDVLPTVAEPTPRAPQKP